jgi:ADP-ribosyltransferase exoenzyme
MSIQQRLSVLLAADSKQLQLQYMDMREALHKYGNWHANEINTGLRKGNLSPELASIVADIDKGFATKGLYQITKKPQWAYRGIGYGSKENIPKFRKGQTFIDKAYSSCSKVERIAENAIGSVGLFYEIRLPIGTKYLLGRGDEAEIILARGSGFKIKGYTPSESNKDFEDRYIMQVTMDYISPKDK